jgi:hypothetical protein
MLVPALGALASHLAQTVPVRLDIADGAGVPVPPAVDARLSALAAALGEQGFDSHATVAPASRRGSIYARVLIHSGDAVRAWAIEMSRGLHVPSYVELITEWENDTAVMSASFPTLTAIYAVNVVSGGDTCAAPDARRWGKRRDSPRCRGRSQR